MIPGRDRGRTGRVRALSGYGSGAFTVLMSCACTCGHPCADSSQGTTLGELGNGVFVYQCVDASDHVCDPQSDTPRNFPELVGLGGSFGMTYTPTDATIGSISVRSPTSLVEEDGGLFTAMETGWAAIGAYRGDELMDVVHVQIVVPELQITSDASASIPVGGTLRVGVDARSADVPVAGALPYVWSSSNPGIARLSEDSDPSRVKLTGVSEGSVTLTVDAVEASAGLVVEVTPGDPGSTGETAATGDTGDTGGAR